MASKKTREELRWVAAHYFILIMGVVFATGFLTFVYATKGLEGLVRFKAGPIVFHFDNMIVILMSSIVGLAPAMLSFLILFICSIIIDIGRAYTVFVYLIAAIVAFLAVRKRWYIKGERTLYFLAPFLAFLLGDVQMVLAALAGGRGISGITPMSMLYFFVGELPECTVAVALSYLFLAKAPDRVRMLTGTGRLYVSGAADKSDMFARIRYSRLSRMMVGLISVEGVVLCVAASAFANALLPDLGEEAFSNKEGNFIRDILTFGEDALDMSEKELEDYMNINGVYIDAPNNDWNPSEKSEEESVQPGEEGEGVQPGEEDEDKESRRAWRREHRRFVLNRSGVAFDIKLIMLLLNTAIPFTVLANLFAHKVIVSPIIRMSESINEFCDVPQDDKESKLKEIRSLPIRNQDEIGELYFALSQMAANIVHFVDEEREKEKLAADLLIAQKTSENKSNFLSSVSHELRTPINAVLGLDEMILRECADPDIISYATDIQNAGKTLLGLVNDILDSSKLEEGKMELIPTEYELSSMINDLLNMISVKAEDKGLELLVNVDEEIPHILYGDEIRLKQVILNILTNAVKYTERGSVRMDIGYEKTDDDHILLKVRVKDTGIGIREEDMGKLFSRFERIEEDRNKNIEGTGLGMDIVQRLLALMGTKLEVESVYGEGSDFHFEVIQQVVKWQPIGNFSEAYRKFVEGIKKHEADFVAPEARILVVDDTVMNLTVVKGLLKETKINVITAQSGAEALDKIKESSFDIIFMDQRMPQMDGVQTFHEMEKLSASGENKSKDAPVIMLTANAISGSREQYLKEGFSDYLSKPIDPQKLEVMVREYLPEEKLLDPAEYEASLNEAKAESEIAADPSEAVQGKSQSKDAALEALKGLASIDYKSALKNCGSEELLMEVLHDYLEAVPIKHAAIKGYYEEGDYENYTILVHALKSSSRLIGASQLSEDAAYLEKCGDAAKNGDEAAKEEIAKKTPPLLKLYRSYYDKLTPLLSGGTDRDLRPEIGIEDLKEAFYAIREFVEAFDFDSADGVMDMLKDYRMPQEYIKTFEEIRQALSSVDRDRVLSSLEKEF